ncbi:MAG TPA: hypothetical protein VLX92_21200 [Kofleriaceae bacterium]|nr:hypothetical protein [Kofleriaceae bacterium]
MKLVLVIALTVVSSLAFADEAAEHVAKATRAYNIQDWSVALKEFKAAYELDPKPETLWSIAQTQRLSGDCRAAILTYKAYMRSASSAGANAAMDWIKSCEADLEAQQKVVDAAVAPKPEPEPKPTPTPAPAPAPPKPVTPPPPRAPAPPHHRSALLDPLGDALVIAGIGGLGVGGTMFAIGALDSGDATSKPTAGAYNHAVSDAKNEQTIGAIVGGAGVVLVALAVWRFESVSAHSNERAPAVTVVPTVGGAFASIHTSF